MLYATHGTELDGRAAVRWYRLDATNFALLESGTLSDPDLDLFYPSIAANPAGTMVIAFNGSSLNSFVSSYAIAGSLSDGVTFFSNRLLLRAGTANYHDGGRTSRWGDYSTTRVDPVDPNKFWTIQTIAAGPSTWTTQITELLTATTLPALAIQRSGANVILSWPQSAISFGLNSTPDLGLPTWTAATGMYTTNSGLISIQIPATNDAAFFRLNML